MRIVYDQDIYYWQITVSVQGATSPLQYFYHLQEDTKFRKLEEVSGHESG